MLMMHRVRRVARASLRGGMKVVLHGLKLLPEFERADAVDILLGVPAVVETARGKILVLNHGRGSCWRAHTLMTKEPDSLKWIDSMQPGSVLWDIGANIGALTLYAAQRGDLEVWAFEPAAVNYYSLAANCELNGFEKRVRCLQLGFSDKIEIADLHVSQLMTALSFTFKESTKNKPNKKIYPSRQAVQLCTIDDFIGRYQAPVPNYVKIDVPGLTPEILAGARRTLAHPAIRQIQVEAKEHNKSGQRIAEFLAQYGFKIVGRGMRLQGQLQRDLVFARDGNPERSLPGALRDLASEMPLVS
jgi:FkbM family methyltransferase